jgi:shikimate dehydrogenase
VLGGQTRLVGIIGKPVGGSLSPRMQNAAFAACGLDWAYVPLEVEPARVGDAVRGLVALGFAGANVTAPYKQDVIPFCDELDAVAERAGSVNTLVLEAGRVLGSSTDTAALDGLAVARAAVLGAGGAALAWIAALESSGAEVKVFSRKGEWPPRSEGFDLVVNATPVNDQALVELRPDLAVIDLPYNADGAPTALVEAAKAAGCQAVVDGYEVLARQGAVAFERWTGVAAPLDVMRAALRP